MYRAAHRTRSYGFYGRFLRVNTRTVRALSGTLDGTACDGMYPLWPVDWRLLWASYGLRVLSINIIIVEWFLLTKFMDQSQMQPMIFQATRRDEFSLPQRRTMSRNNHVTRYRCWETLEWDFKFWSPLYFGECGGISGIISYCEVIMDLTTNELCSRNASLLDFLDVVFISSLDLLQVHAEYFFLIDNIVI